METQDASSVRDGLSNGIGFSPTVSGGLDLLLKQARGGSKPALGQLLERCQRYLLLVANESLDSDLRAKGGASDLVQDTFLEAHQDFPRFQGSTEPELLAWLTKILTNRVSNNARHYRRALKRNVNREVSLEAGCDPGELCSTTQVSAPINAIIANDDTVRLQAALQRLPEAMREVLILKTWDRQTFVEIGARLQASPDAMRKLWGRAVQRLQIELQEEL